MGVRLEEARYGKSRVRVLHVGRQGATHEVAETTVAVVCEGDFGESYTGDDNRRVLATDTMKNTIYALARREPPRPLETFGERLGREFLGECPWLARVGVELVGHRWTRLAQRTGGHPHAFVSPGGETRTASVTVARDGMVIRSGLDGLEVMKTTESGFAGFPRTRYTTLPETGDRILRTIVSANWTWRARPGDFDAAHAAVRAAFLEAFGAGYSPSVQHTLGRMAALALERVDELATVHLSLPNRHCLLVDLAPFGLDNPNQVFVATDEPHGLIEATFGRE
ncbi:MAG TPA: urate oxidase [Dongiaceae bacterium]|nr:urate oxidase [Dongiaceae bacterium]